MESLTERAGSRGDLCAILPGHTVMQTRLQGLGY